jgi:hypothetical protein
MDPVLLLALQHTDQLLFNSMIQQYEINHFTPRFLNVVKLKITRYLMYIHQ